MLGILSLIPGRALLYAGVAVAALAAGAWALHQHDARVVAEQRADAQALAISQMQADHARAVAALETRAAEAEARAEASATIRSAIHAAPVTSACASSPAVRAALDGLRGRAGANGDPRSGSGQPANLPAGTVAAKPQR